MRKRDTRFATQERYTTLSNPLHDKSRPKKKKTVVVFGPEDFRYDPVARTCICPAGKSLNRRGAANVTGGHVGEHFQGAPRDCGPCPLRAQYLRTPGTTPVRNVAFCRDRVGRDVNDSALMRDRIDASAGRAQYARSTREQAPRSFCPARQWEGRCAVEAVVPRAQHREAREQRIRRLTMRTTRIGCALGDSQT